MTDFSHLGVLDVTSDTLVEYTFAMIPGEPSIWIAPATDDNALYLNERLRIAAERASKAVEEQKRRGGKTKGPVRVEVTAEDFEADRDVDRELLARCCCKRWGTAPRDVDGNFPEFDAETCLDFLRALPNWMLDPFRAFAGNTFNFIPKVGPDFQLITDETKDALGNS
jgi:hypothetical protein